MGNAGPCQSCPFAHFSCRSFQPVNCSSNPSCQHCEYSTSRQSGSSIASGDTFMGKQLSNIKAMPPSNLVGIRHSSRTALAYETASGPCGTMVLCNEAPPGKNPFEPFFPSWSLDVA